MTNTPQQMILGQLSQGEFPRENLDIVFGYCSSETMHGGHGYFVLGCSVSSGPAAKIPGRSPQRG